MDGGINVNFDRRQTTSLRIPEVLTDHVKSISRVLGIPKNAFFTLGACFLVLQVVPLIPGRKRAAIVADLEKIVLKCLENAKLAI